MNFMYTPGVPAGTQVPYQPTFVPQGVIGTQLGQLAGNYLGQFLPGPFGAIASQLLPQVGNLLPFQAGPQSAFVPQQSPFVPQGVIGNPWGHPAGGIAGQIQPGPYGGIPTQWMPQAGTVIPFQGGPQTAFGQQSGIGGPFSQLGGGIGGPMLPGPYGGFPTQWTPQAGTVMPFHGGPQAVFVPQGAIGGQLGQLAGGIGGQIQPGPYGGIPTQWMPQAGMPFHGGPQAVFVPQGVIGGQLGQLAGGILGQILPGPFGGIASQLLPQLGSVLLPFQAGPQQPVPMGGYGLNQPFVTVGVQW